MQRIWASPRTALNVQRIPARVAFGGAQWLYRHNSSVPDPINEARVLYISRYARGFKEVDIQAKLKQFEGFVELKPVDYKAPKFRFAIFESPEHAQAALEKIAVQPLEGPPQPLHVRYHAPTAGETKGNPSNVLFFGEMSPKVNTADVEALLKQFSGFVSFEKEGTSWFAKFDTIEDAKAARASITQKPDFPPRPWNVRLAKQTKGE